MTAAASARIIEARRCIVTGLFEARVFRTDEVAGEDHAGEVKPEHEVFLAEERLHPSLDEIFGQSQKPTAQEASQEPVAPTAERVYPIPLPRVSTSETAPAFCNSPPGPARWPRSSTPATVG